MHGVLLDTSSAGTQWGAIAIALLTLIYIVFVRPLKKGKRDPLARKPADAALAQQRAMERDMTALLVEYEQMMRTMSAQIETRVAKLELLIRDADQRLAALSANSLPPDAQPLPSDNSPLREIVRLDLPEPPAEVEPAQHRDVYQLADQGLSHRQIAQRLDRAYGEIELILALRAKIAPGAQFEPPSTPSIPDRPSDGEARHADANAAESELVHAAVAESESGLQLSSAASGDRSNQRHQGRRRKKHR